MQCYSTSLIEMLLFSAYNQHSSFMGQNMEMLPEKTADC